MKSNLKILGLALVAALAMGMVASASASADFLAFNTAAGETEGGEVQLSADGTQIFKPTASGELAVECTEVVGHAATSGVASETTFTGIAYHGSAPEGTCTTNPLDLPVHVRMNGCHITFHIGPAHASIECETAEKAIELEVTKSGGGKKCLITIGSDEEIGAVSYSEATDGEGHEVIQVTSEAEEINSTTEGSLLNCGVANGEHTTGLYEGTVTLSAFNLAEEPVDALSYAPLKGTQIGAHAFKPAEGGALVACQTASFVQTGEGEVPPIVLSPHYEECTATEGSLEVDAAANGCELVLHPGEEVSADRFKGTADVQCPEGKAIEFRLTGKEEETKCLISIPAQEGIGPVYFEDETEESPEDVVFDIEAANVMSTTEGGLANCGVLNGEHSGGLYGGEATVRAFDEEGDPIDFSL